MEEYFGIIETDRIPYRFVVRFHASSVEEAKQKYEAHCENTHGHIWQLYKVNDKWREENQPLYEDAREEDIVYPSTLLMRYFQLTRAKE